MFGKDTEARKAIITLQKQVWKLQNVPLDIGATVKYFEDRRYPAPAEAFNGKIIKAVFKIHCPTLRYPDYYWLYTIIDNKSGEHKEIYGSQVLLHE